ncbi:MAG TPA: hypothetical protein VEU30_04330 [Thermoanaerobaculia bacterium]|nr:hypothetical protein [Thermoanaerobaculia bacterium]
MAEKISMNAIKRSSRYRVVLNVPVKLGLKDGTLVDVSSAGALVTHAGALKTGAESDMTFTFEGKKFFGKVKVGSCGVVGLGAGQKGTTLFASRLYFTENLPDESKQIVESILNPPED